MKALKGEIAMKATQQLKDEHQVIKTVFCILEKVCDKLKADGTLNTEHFEGILTNVMEKNTCFNKSEYRDRDLLASCCPSIHRGVIM